MDIYLCLMFLFECNINNKIIDNINKNNYDNYD